MAYAISNLILFLSMLPFSALAQSQGNITVGKSLSANDDSSNSWLSPSGDFAFGFSKIENNLYLLSIWYDNIPSKTIVWYANEGKLVETGSKVQLTADKGLVLSSPQGDELWKSDPVMGTTAYAHMNDTGNFVIKDLNSQDLWGSFSYPTDTILPFQTIERNGYLNSRKTEKDFSPGKFRFTLLDSGNLVLSTLSLPTTYLNEPYYESRTNDGANASNSGVNVVYNESGYLYVSRDNGQKFMLSQGNIFSSETFYHRATLNFDGVFTQYYHSKTTTGNGSWSVLWSEPENICLASRVNTGSGTCGYNSICTLGTNQRPTCKCPPGYSLSDPNDQYGSCIPNFGLDCQDVAQVHSPEDQYHIEELQNSDWPISDYALLKPFTKDECADSCLKDCMCAVSIFRDNTCWKKKLPLSNGRTDSGEPSVAFLKIGNVNSTKQIDCYPIPEPKEKNRDGLIVGGSLMLGSSVIVNLILLCTICYGFFAIHKKKSTRISEVETNLRCFTYKELAEATNGFKEELGRGAFGIVYKGEMNTSCGNLVAVKKLDRMMHEGEKEFKAEVNVIGQTHHKNLVRLLGFCNEGPNRLLVYEYLSNGTLSRFLFQDQKLGWNQRMEIIFGIARGILYLHEECVTQIIHCDIKPENILLDDSYSARISDFGLAKLLNIGKSYIHTGIRGTKGYVAPEWFRNQSISVKVDVYSFGVMLLEIICCRRNVEHEISSEETPILTDWVFDCYSEGKLDEIVVDDMEAINDGKRLERFVMVALWCIQEDMLLRPSMRQVNRMLEGVVEVGVPPCPSPYTLTDRSRKSAV